MKKQLSFVLAMTLVLSWSASADALTAGGNAGVEGVWTTHTLMPFSGISDDVTEGLSWVIEEEVTRDDNAGRWVKHLYGFDDRQVLNGSVGENNDNHPPVFAEVGTRYVLLELLQVGGKTDWSDWHEEILTPGWVWADSSFLVADEPEPTEINTPLLSVTEHPADSFQDIQDNPAPGLSVNFSDDGTVLDFYFNSVDPGQYVSIVKVLEYVGYGQTHPNDQLSELNGNGDFFEGVIEIAQYPTPEPVTATLGLVGLGALMLSTRRRRTQ